MPQHINENMVHLSKTGRYFHSTLQILPVYHIGHSFIFTCRSPCSSQIYCKPSVRSCISNGLAAAMSKLVKSAQPKVILYLHRRLCNASPDLIICMILQLGQSNGSVTDGPAECDNHPSTTGQRTRPRCHKFALGNAWAETLKLAM